MLIASATATGSSRGAMPSLVVELEKSTRIEIRYFDPARERRTPASVGSIDDTYDMSASITCDGENCRTAMPWLEQGLRLAKPGKCLGKPYSRFTFFRSDGTKFVFYGDRGGQCIWVTGLQMILKKNLLVAVKVTPLRDW